jgi:hypothetical protein
MELSKRKRLYHSAVTSLFVLDLVKFYFTLWRETIEDADETIFIARRRARETDVGYR